MTLGSCRAKKEDSVGAGPHMFVNLFLMAQYRYAGQSNRCVVQNDVHPLLDQKHRKHNDVVLLKPLTAER